MRITVDALGAPGESGGMNLYARELLKAWAGDYPDDELIVVGGEWVRKEFAPFANITPVARRSGSVLRRSWGQLVASGALARRTRSDVLLSVSPIASPLIKSPRRAAVVHDWRHVRRPQEFGAAQRLYRRLWTWSVRSAGTVITISAKTADETRTITGRQDLTVVTNGEDHPGRWKKIEGPKSKSLVLTYGHFVNKRPEAVIQAVAQLRRRRIQVELCVLGAVNEYQEDLRALAARHGVADAVSFPGYVDEVEYQQSVQRCAVMVLNSSDEGFGLPVSEARYFGTPVIVAADSGLDTIHGDGVIVSDPSAEELSNAIESALAAGGSGPTSRQTWADCAAAVRRALIGKLT